MTHPEIDPAAEARRALEASLYECKRVVVGQDAMLERLLVALLTGGHVLLEGVPGLAKTLTVRTLATVLGGSFGRIQFTPDLVPADLVGTRLWQPGDGTFRTELGPVFANLLLADEINRAPAKVQSALLEVMQEHQVTIGGTTHRVPEPFLVLATQNPIESEGTYDLPEAQVDRFLFKLVVDYPSVEDEIAVVDRVSVEMPRPRPTMAIESLLEHQQVARQVFADRSTIAYAVSLVDATRHPGRYGLADLEPLIQFGASPRASLGLVQAARALALLRGRTHVRPQGRPRPRRRRAAPPARALLRRARRRRAARRPDRPPARRGRAGQRASTWWRRRDADRPTRPPGPRAARQRGGGPARPRHRAPRGGPAPRRAAGAGRRPGHGARAAAALRARRRPAPARRGRERAHRRPARPPARARARADHLDRARPQRLDGVRHRPAAEVRRRRGRRLDDRAARGAPRRACRGRDRRRARERDAAAALRPRRVRRRAAAGRRRRRPRRDGRRAAAARGARAHAPPRAHARAGRPSSPTSATTAGRRRCARSPSATP